jgi:hypothetical protein
MRMPAKLHHTQTASLMKLQYETFVVVVVVAVAVVAVAVVDDDATVELST